MAFFKNIIKAFSGDFGGAVITTGTYPRKGSQELLELYKSSPWLKAVVGKISSGEAAVPWKLYTGRDPSTGKPSRAPANILRLKKPELRQQAIQKLVDTRNLQEITDHPLLEMLHHGNPFMSGMAAFRVVYEHIELVGEGAFYLRRNGIGAPSSMWPIPPTWIKRLPDENHDTFELRLKATASTVEVNREDLIWIKHPDVVNPYNRGAGTALSLGDEIEMDEAVSKYLASFFMNNARPDFIVYGEGFTAEEGDRVERKWMEKQRGFWRRFKPLFINKDITIKEMSKNFDQLEMTQLRKHERDVIMQVYGIPPERLGVLVNSNRSTIDAGDHFWQKDIIEPRLEFIREILQRQLVPQFDSRLVIDYQQAVVRDREEEQNIMTKAPFALSINEYREKMNMPSLGEGGDVHLLPLNHVLVKFGEGIEILGTTVQSGQNEPPEEQESEGEEELQEEGGSDGTDKLSHIRSVN